MMVFEMMYLGKEQRTSGKTGKVYFIAKFLMKQTGEIFEFYVKGDNALLIGELQNVNVAQDCKLQLDLRSNRGKPEIELTRVAKK